MAAHRSPSAINGDGSSSTTPGFPCLSATSFHHDAVTLDDTSASSRKHRDAPGTSPAVEYSAVPNDEKLSGEIRSPFSTKFRDSTEVNVNETENNSLLYQPLNRLATLKQWAFELVTLFISVAAFVFMVILMMAVNEKPQPAWAYVVNINTLVAIFTTLLRAAVVLITAEVMGQAKWSWMASPRPLRHVKRFDDASKGAWGSLKFLLHTWKSPPTVLGALIVIASYAIGPFSQQAVKTYPCPIQAEGVARISIAERVAGLDSTRDPGFLSGEMSSVVINGLLSMLPDSSQLFDCDSGNCTFGSISGVTHSSAGVCSKCTDVRSGLLEFDDRGPTVNGRYQPEYRFHNNSDFGINTAVEPILFNMTTSTTYATPFMTSFLTLTAAGCVAKVNEKGQANRYCQHKYENMPKLSSDLDIAAANCTFYPCVRHYEGAITNGTLRERLISDEPMAFRDNLPIEEFYGEYVSMIRPCILNGESYDLSNITSVSRDGLNWTSWSSGGVSYEAPHQCLRVLPELEYVGITNFLADNLKGSCRLFDSSELWYSPDSFEKNYTSINTIGGINSKVKCETGWWLKALHMRGNATFEALAAAHNNMSMAITNRMRANGLTLSTTETSRSYKEGTVNQMSICVRLDGLWLLYPGVLLVLTSALLVTAYIQSCQDRERQPVWKSAILPLLFYNISNEQDSDERNNSTGASSSVPLLQLTELESLADKTVVSFRSGDEGARFVVEE